MPDQTSTPTCPEGSERAKPVGGKRKAVRHRGPRRALFPGLPSVQIVAGVAALAAAAVGAVSLPGEVPLANSATASSSDSGRLQPAGALSGTSAVGSSSLLAEREKAVSRDSAGDALEDASAKKIIKAAEAQAKQRNAALAQFAKQAEQQAQEIAANKWVLPLTNYRLTATFGQSGSLWSRDHTGLDFAAPSGTPLRAVTNATVTEAGYAGAYGNRTILTLEDGTELWYCHQTSISVSPGDTVSAGEVIGTVGATGNVTGPHLHLEVRPGAGDPVDPYNALSVNGVRP
ncbi:M23 family metallopeptidase [Nocardioides rotundus]|uniref:M23 family metallopeptidase n=1 Tax=Nocardioides rotundus TaxID=1774216 RepID=UPI001CBCC2E6|nr:M23 family metallopeptidase [Nocardioides rotundus]UAL28718.1 M23 family metallopeptidase [Nocardioides rotundus]